MRCCTVMIAAAAACNSPSSSTATNAVANGPASFGVPESLHGERVTFASGSLTLTGYLYVPQGNGPFPAIVWNHGSQQEVGSGQLLAGWYVDNGFVLFYPHRRGHGRSENAARYIGDIPEDDAPALVNELVAQSDDVIAAAAYVATLPYVDPQRIATIGCSFGGIEALFAAEQGTGIVSAVDFAGAAYMWSRTPPLRERMKLAARNARVPVFFIQAENDADTTPTRVLAEEMKRAGKPHRAHVFPPNGTSVQDGHSFCAGSDHPAWGDEVLTFLAETMRR